MYLHFVGIFAMLGYVSNEWTIVEKINVFFVCEYANQLDSTISCLLWCNLEALHFHSFGSVNLYIRELQAHNVICDFIFQTNCDSVVRVCTSSHFSSITHLRRTYRWGIDEPSCRRQSPYNWKKWIVCVSPEKGRFKFFYWLQASQQFFAKWQHFPNVFSMCCFNWASFSACIKKACVP